MGSGKKYGALIVLNYMLTNDGFGPVLGSLLCVCVCVFCNINIIMLINQSELYHLSHSYFLYMSLPS